MRDYSCQFLNKTPFLMNAPLQSLIHALRNELQQYGEILVLLDQQRECAVTHTAEDVLLTVSGIQTQSAAIQMACDNREQCRRNLALALHQPPECALTELIPLLPEDYRPLLQALVEENRELWRRIQQRVHQNHRLLSRSLDSLQRFMNSLATGLRPPEDPALIASFPIPHPIAV